MDITQQKDFPVFKTKVDGVNERFNLSDPTERARYFQAKAGPEIEKLKQYQGGDSFLSFLIGKKNTGKGTYSKLFMEIMGKDKNGHLSVGDLVRDVHSNLDDPEKRKEMASFMEANYRGFHGVEQIIELIEGRSQTSLISTELIIALIKFEISKRPKQSLFIDGFPRAIDQITYSIFLKELIGYREDPDLMTFISVPEGIIDERIKSRRVCPKCKTPRNLKLLATKEVGYDKDSEEFYLICDDQDCGGARMEKKEGDELGIEPIRKRLEADDEVMQELLKLQGIPKVYLRNAIPIDLADGYVDEYELTPSYSYELDDSGKVTTIESPWVVKDDEGVDSYSLLPAAVVLGMVKQFAAALKL